MKAILRYIRQYFYEVEKPVLAGVSALAATLIFINYHYGVDEQISRRSSFIVSLLARYLVFLPAFALPYFFYRVLTHRNYYRNSKFLFLLLVGPAVFSLKVALNIPVHFSENDHWNSYWDQVIYWPLLVLITSSIIFLIWKKFDRDQTFYGIRTRGMNWRPYWKMLLVVLPLVTLASTQQDFLAVYPKLKLIAGVYAEEGLHWWHKLLFELSYGTDFITIELFFRGFLILAFIKWAGKDAILPIACFYCTIHFGKPLGECISSYFGGIILGIVVYHTRSILGGLMVHLGIAWMMELGGWLGNTI